MVFSIHADYLTFDSLGDTQFDNEVKDLKARRFIDRVMPRLRVRYAKAEVGRISGDEFVNYLRRKSAYLARYGIDMRVYIPKQWGCLLE